MLGKLKSINELLSVQSIKNRLLRYGEYMIHIKINQLNSNVNSYKIKQTSSKHQSFNEFCVQEPKK